MIDEAGNSTTVADVDGLGKAKTKGGTEPWASEEQLRWFQDEAGRFKAARTAKKLDEFWPWAFETWNKKWSLGAALPGEGVVPEEERVAKLKKVRTFEGQRDT